MSKFKKGDRVKVLAGHGMEGFGAVTGMIGIVNEHGSGVPFVTLPGVKHDVAFIEGKLELVADEPKFKVGDRVRVVKDGLSTTGAVGMLGTVRDIIEGRPNPFQVEMDKGGTYHSVAVSGSYCWSWFAADAIVPATLTIQAGRYYKTRDGRKVGPMRDDWNDGEWPFHVTSGILSGNLWDASGKNYLGLEPHTDLIAEWVDELATAASTVAVAATAGNDNAAPAKFKVGDRVRIVTAGMPHKKGHIGREFTISSQQGTINGEPAWIGYPESRPYRWKSSELELVTSTPAIVCLIENGQPRPSDRPHVHADRTSATKEAGRLAGKHPGKEFGVYELVHRHRVEPVYKHEWQRLAAGDQKIDAIKELRARTGLTLKGAKDAVEHWLIAGEPYARLAA